MIRGRIAVAAMSCIGLLVAVATGFMARGMLGRSAVAEVQKQELITLYKGAGDAVGG